MSTLRSFVDAIENENMADAQNAFNSAVADRLNSALDDKKVEVAASMYGSGDEVTADLEDLTDEDFAIDAEPEQEVEITDEADN